MKKTRYDIGKTNWGNEIYRAINRIPEIEKDLRLSEILMLKFDEERSQYYFLDSYNKYLFIWMNKSDVVDCMTFETWESLYLFLDGLYLTHKDTPDLWIDSIKDAIKEVKIAISSKTPNKIKEISKGKTNIKLGDKLYTSWGYDQTNVEMFKVVKIIGKNYLIIQEIAQRDTQNEGYGAMATTVTATEVHLDKLPVKAFISNDGYMSVCEGGYKRGLYKHTEGENHYKSWGH